MVGLFLLTQKAIHGFFKNLNQIISLVNNTKFTHILGVTLNLDTKLYYSFHKPSQ